MPVCIHPRIIQGPDRGNHNPWQSIDDEIIPLIMNKNARIGKAKAFGPTRAQIM